MSQSHQSSYYDPKSLDSQTENRIISGIQWRAKKRKKQEEKKEKKRNSKIIKKKENGKAKIDT